MRRSLALVPLLALAGCGGGSSSSSKETAKVTTTEGTTSTAQSKPAAHTVTLTDAKSRFRITVPRGYALSVHKGLYVMKKGAATITYSRVTSPTAPETYDATLRKTISVTA